MSVFARTAVSQSARPFHSLEIVVVVVIVGCCRSPFSHQIAFKYSCREYEVFHIRIYSLCDVSVYISLPHRDHFRWPFLDESANQSTNKQTTGTNAMGDDHNRCRNVYVLAQIRFQTTMNKHKSHTHTHTRLFYWPLQYASKRPHLLRTSPLLPSHRHTIIRTWCLKL